MLAKRSGLRFIKALLILLVAMMLATPARAYFVPTNGQAATLVLGQSSFTSNTGASSQSGLFSPEDVAVDPISHKVFVADRANSRVVRYASIYTLASGTPAEAVLGQPDFGSSNPATSRNGMDSPRGVFVDAAGRLWVSDTDNDRVLRFDNAASKANGANADAVLGQTGFSSSGSGTTQSTMDLPSGLYVDASGRLWVADSGNNRVLRFDDAASKANGDNADGVLGQTDFTGSGTGTTASTMRSPRGVSGDGSGRIWVADYYNSRVLRFDKAASKTDGADADGVLGQPGFVSSIGATTQAGMYLPTDVTVDPSTGRLYVDDFLNSRILGFNNAAAITNGHAASVVLGQANFISSMFNAGGTPSASTLFLPWGVFYDPATKVFLTADYFNNRILVYGLPSRYIKPLSVASYDGWVRESTATSGVGGSLLATGNLQVGDDAANRQYRSILYFNTSGLPDTGIVIRSATLRIRKVGVVGSNPFSTLGLLMADIKKGTFGTAALQIGDFQALPSAAGIGHFTAISSLPDWYQLVVPAADFQFINRTGATQFRIRFAKGDNGNSTADFVSFYAGDAATSTNRPILTVEYTAQ